MEDVLESRKSSLSLRERESEEYWTLLVPTVPTASEATRARPDQEYELCSDVIYRLPDPDRLRVEMEASPRQRTALAVDRGLFPFIPAIERVEEGGRAYLRITFPKSVPQELRTMIKDAIRYEAERNPAFEKCRIFANLHLETQEKHDTHALIFHQDFENYREASVYAVAGRPTTIGTSDEAGLGRTPDVAARQGVSTFSILPERMYHWSDHFVHATPPNRFEGEFAGQTRPFGLIGFVYDEQEVFYKKRK